LNHRPPPPPGERESAPGAGFGAERLLDALRVYVEHARDPACWGKDHDRQHLHRFGVLLAEYDQVYPRDTEEAKR
jgi:hypothetical protein